MEEKRKSQSRGTYLGRGKVNLSDARDLESLAGFPIEESEPHPRILGDVPECGVHLIPVVIVKDNCLGTSDSH